jgi:hypothetical protein
MPRTVAEAKRVLDELCDRVEAVIGRRSVSEARRSREKAKVAADTFQATYNSEFELEDEGSYAAQPRNHNTLGDPYRNVGDSDPRSRQDEGTANLYHSPFDADRQFTSGDATKINTIGNKFPLGKSHESRKSPRAMEAIRAFRRTYR